MSGLTSPQSFPNDPYPEQNGKKRRELLPKEQQQYTPFPIDESEDFYDPYSDLSLFLSKRIKNELQKNGSVKQWSTKIQKDLLSKILPEFHKRFPHYRLGGSALKKIWEKVAYYYERIQTKKEAFKENGSLNIPFMIRENLKHLPKQSAMKNIPPYTSARHIASKMSECIALLDGIRPNVDLLTKTIWATQKHILPELTSLAAKNPNDQYDNMDKLIVKTLLEQVTNYPTLPSNQLAQKMKTSLQELKQLAELFSKHQLHSAIATHLSELFLPRSALFTTLNQDEKFAIRAFIENQVDLSSYSPEVTIDTYHIELVQRVLSLYPIASNLPTNVNETDFKKAVEYVYEKSLGTEPDACPSLHQNIYIFIHGELHMRRHTPAFTSLLLLQKYLWQSYLDAIKLPKISLHYFDQLEMLIWQEISKTNNLLEQLSEPMRKRLKQEIYQILIDSPSSSFTTLIRTTLEFFKKVKKAFTEGGSTLKAKIHIWSLQNDMLLRYAHFDSNHYLLKLIREEWNINRCKEYTVNHHQFVQEIANQIKKEKPILCETDKELQKRIWILYKYFWYHELLGTRESSFDRFLKWHYVRLSYLNPELNKHAIYGELKRICENVLPLIPFEANLVA